MKGLSISLLPRRQQRSPGEAGLELKRAEAQLELRLIRSPVSGLVTERLMSGGEYVRQDSAVLSSSRSRGYRACWRTVLNPTASR